MSKKQLRREGSKLNICHRLSKRQSSSNILKVQLSDLTFIGDLKSFQDVIMSLKSTISNKKATIDSLEAKLIGFNRVIANLSTSNFTMLSSKITEMEARVKHYEDLYKQEVIDREKIEEVLKQLEVKKLRVEKDHKDSLDSYTKIFTEIKKLKI